jgi:hypothetical protein
VGKHDNTIPLRFILIQAYDYIDYFLLQIASKFPEISTRNKNIDVKIEITIGNILCSELTRLAY